MTNVAGAMPAERLFSDHQVRLMQWLYRIMWPVVSRMWHFGGDRVVVNDSAKQWARNETIPVSRANKEKSTSR